MYQKKILIDRQPAKENYRIISKLIFSILLEKKIVFQESVSTNLNTSSIPMDNRYKKLLNCLIGSFNCRFN